MIVSHSNMKSFQKCEMKFYFDVKLNIKPKEYPEAVKKGIVGHKFMEIFFETYMETGDYDASVAAVSAYVGDFISEDPRDTFRLECSKLLRQVTAFGAYVLNQPWKIVEIEKNETAAITEEAEFGYTPDIICEWTSGPKRGLPFVLDYKFTGQYWNDRQINTVQQMLKYLIYYNEKHGTKMRHAGLVMVNTRAPAGATGNQLFLLKWLPVSKKKLENVRRENEILVNRIEPFFRMTAEEFKEIAVRTTDEYACKTCWYADDVCPMDLNGEPIDHALEANYEKNNYGYN